MIKIRYASIPNANHENHLLSNVKNLPGLAGLIIEVLNVEAELSLNDNIQDIIKPIFKRLGEINLPNKTKYGQIGPPRRPLTGELVKIDSDLWHHGTKWSEFIFTHSQRKI